MHVRSWWSRQHVRESKNWLLVQSVVGGAQFAGNVLGETTENLPSHSSTDHPPAAPPGTDTHANPAAQIDGGTGVHKERTIYVVEILKSLMMFDGFNMTLNAFLHLGSPRFYFLFWEKKHALLTVTVMF